MKGYPKSLPLDKRQPEMLTESYIESVYTPPIHGRQAGVAYALSDRDYTAKGYTRKVVVNGIEGLQLVVKS